MNKKLFILTVSILGCAQSGLAMEKQLRNDSESAWSLIEAAKNNDLPRLEQLLNEIEVDAHNNQNNGTALMAASQKGHVAACKLLLDHGATVDCTSKAGRTALFFAANTEIAQLLIKAGSNVNHIDSDCNASVLMWHACSGQDAICTLLLKAGANVNYANIEDHNALFWAMLNNRLSTCKLIVEKIVSLPDDTQKQRIYALLNCLRLNPDETTQATYTPCIIDSFKSSLRALIRKENMSNPQSRARQEVDRLKDGEIKQNLLQEYFLSKK